MVRRWSGVEEVGGIGEGDDVRVVRIAWSLCGMRLTLVR